MGSETRGARTPKAVETCIALAVAQRQRWEYAEAGGEVPLCSEHWGRTMGSCGTSRATVANGGESGDALRTSRCAVDL